MRFYVYFNRTIEGPYDVAELKTLPHFSPDLQVSVEGDLDWQPASNYPILVPPKAPPAVATQIASAPTAVPARIVSSGDYPELRTRPWSPSAAASSPKPAASSQKKANVGRPAPAWFSRLTQALQKQRKTILMGFLWLVVFGIYGPQTDTLLAIYDGLAYPAEMAPLHGTAWVHRGPRKKILYKRASRLPAEAAAAVTSAPILTVDEIASDDLGDGTVLKTIVVTRNRDGVKVEQTRTIVVPKRRLHSRPSM